jgi:hypothetical protein
MAKPSDYLFIAAWHRLYGENRGWNHQAISGAQRRAANADAPLNAVYHGPEGWVTFDELGVQTKMSLMVQLNKKGKRT